MLVLSRKVGDKIMIGEDITLEVLSISSKSIRLGIVAPKEVPVFRSELLEVRHDNVKAANPPTE